MKEIARLLSTALMTAILLYRANAQSPQIPLQGRVLDPTSAAIPGAQITAVRDGSRTQLTAVSDRNGEFSLAVEPGQYTVKIAAQGFSGTSQQIFLQKREPGFPGFLLVVCGVPGQVTVNE